jgi:peptidoglycan/LPS O-acetylase OafA/YrhL
MGNVRALTSLRFIAALVVFLHHYVAFGGFRHYGDKGFASLYDSFLGRVSYEMRYGVTLFFVLSGFLLAARYFDTIFTKVSFRDYWIKRIARIMPLYWSLLTMVMLTCLFAGDWVNRNSTWPYWVDDRAGYLLQWWPIYYTVTQGFFGKIKFTGMETGWSLTVEECFYLVLPLVIISIRWAWKREMKDLWRYAIMAGALTGFTLLLYQLGRIGYSMRGKLPDPGVYYTEGTGPFYLFDQMFAEGASPLKVFGAYLRSAYLFRTWGKFEIQDWQMFTILGRFSDFAIGIFFGVLYLKTNNWFLKRGWRADVAIAVCIVGVLITCDQIARNGGMQDKDGFALNSLNAFLSAIIIYCLCSRRSMIAKGLAWRPFVYLGEVSFALYLIHRNVMVNWLYGWVDGHGWNFLLSFTLIYAVFTLLAVLCYEIIERPSQYFILEKTIGAPKGRRPTVLRWITGRRRALPAAA